MYKVIFSDLDATLLSDDKSINPKNIEYINKAKEKGVKFVFCTGRLPFCYKNYSKVIDTSDAITTNGAVIFFDNQIIKQIPLSKEVKEKTLEYGIKHHLYERIFCIDYLYLLNGELGGNDTNFYKESAAISNDEARKIIKEKTIYKMAFHMQDHNKLLEIKKEFEKMDLDITMCFANDTFLEINMQGTSKGEGIKKYCELKGIDLKDTIGIGDNDNDSSMFDVVGLACCPSNGIDSIKSKVDYICKNNNNEGAIYEIIDKFILKNG